ncbi:MAG: TatD family hydrolase [Prevotella sp.]|nr:TatD family hydrolase [Prevotella sp.]
MKIIDTHAHIDGEEFAADLPEVLARARAAGVTQILVPAIDLASCKSVLDVCAANEGFVLPMLGLHPEEVRGDFREQLAAIKRLLLEELNKGTRVVAVGEVGLDYYWSREFEREQMEAFREQAEWSVELKLPLMIHCRKAQNELVRLLRDYKADLAGGVFHCFSGNAFEAAELLQFDNFYLGIGGVITFKKSNLAQTLAEAVPLERIVIETDAPYMAPVPKRGQRNESAFTTFIVEKIAEAYGVSAEEVAEVTSRNANELFGFEPSS